MIAPILVDGEGFKVRIEQQHGYLRAYVHGGRDSLAVSIAMWKLLAGLDDLDDVSATNIAALETLALDYLQAAATRKKLNELAARL